MQASDYVVYHIFERMGYPAIEVGNLAIYTRKPATGAVGSRVWLITGTGRPRRYFLRATFIVSGVEVSDRPDFQTRLTGTDGQLFDPMPALHDAPWFPTFIRKQGRFAFGFSPVAPEEASHLRAILLARALR